MNGTEKPVASPVVVLREETDEWALLFHPDTNAVAGINPAGVAIWKLLDGKRDLSAVDAAMRRRFSEMPADSLDRIVRFVEDLRAAGFVGVEG